ncbi:MAG: nuclear transport factor 2 family protein [Pseudobdellovibrionaceae bacterium]
MSAKDILKKCEELINEHNFDLLAPLISNECKFWFSSGTYEGLDQTHKAFERTWGLIKDEVYSVDDKICVA